MCVKFLFSFDLILGVCLAFDLAKLSSSFSLPQDVCIKFMLWRRHEDGSMERTKKSFSCE